VRGLASLLCNTHDATELTDMSYGHLSTMYHDGTVLNGPARPRSTAELFAIRASVRKQRLSRVRSS
jgi:hypothetical protein